MGQDLHLICQLEATKLAPQLVPQGHQLPMVQRRANLSQQIREDYRSGCRTTPLRSVSELAGEITRPPSGHVGTSTKGETLNVRNNSTMPGSCANPHRATESRADLFCVMGLAWGWASWSPLPILSIFKGCFEITTSSISSSHSVRASSFTLSSMFASTLYGEGTPIAHDHLHRLTWLRGNLEGCAVAFPCFLLLSFHRSHST
uniref:Uncharacterized protein n=1 Tax=Cannabis sativa TaxID=3483 RepID=A0A803Q2M7_CANSA